MSEDTAVARVEARLQDFRGSTWLLVKTVDLREFVAAARVWEAHTCQATKDALFMLGVAVIGDVDWNDETGIATGVTLRKIIPKDRQSDDYAEAEARFRGTLEAEIREKVAQEIRAFGERMKPYHYVGWKVAVDECEAVTRGSAGGARP